MNYDKASGFIDKLPKTDSKSYKYQPFSNLASFAYELN
ncbi:hypothetical protein PCIT_b1060 [Pseudoalteromonas citrea]|uniref:Uncharacterized protein n=1 Tax=Pseudoalteromonas citrea TaxID=43655 RepID=A0AAD4AFD0_9GAMM|nr:hypothetical protein PCIT_b1060 [Pseudoalteromonas citrea]